MTKPWNADPSMPSFLIIMKLLLTLHDPHYPFLLYRVSMCFHSTIYNACREP